MGRSGLSSKRKSSKKRLKISSEARRKKRSSRTKSKKLRRRVDSDASYSDDDTSSSVSSTSSEGESRKARSRTRDDVKGGRKRARRRSSGRESSEDSPPVKKRKGSKKKDDSEARRKKLKKRSKKRKVRRATSISSASSDSESCSTCRGGDSSSDDEAESGRPRASSRSREKKKDHRDSIKGKHGSRKNRNRSTSPSSSKSNNGCGDDSIEELVVENNSRRLKSVITVATQLEEQEGNGINKDELKEEIVYDYDDYPSCRSNDSNDGGNKREVIGQANASPEKMTGETAKGEVDSAVNLEAIKPVSPVKSVGDEPVDSKEKEGNAFTGVGSDADDLELILRQKALENLSRYRGTLQAKAVGPVDDKSKTESDAVKQSPPAKIDNIQNQSKHPASKQDGSTIISTAHPVIPRSRFTWTRDPSVVTGKEERSTTQSGAESYRTKAPVPKLHSVNSSLTSSLVNKCAEETSKTVVNANSDTGGVGTSDRSATALETPSCASIQEGSSKEQQTETNESSQFEQKTMSVMRGGEMVQVSYKVYIPKKAPALARRRLKR